MRSLDRSTNGRDVITISQTFNSTGTHSTTTSATTSAGIKPAIPSTAKRLLALSVTLGLLGSTSAVAKVRAH